jgi:hypothetical protein
MTADRAKAEILLAPDSEHDMASASYSSGDARKVMTFDFLFSTDILRLPHSHAGPLFGPAACVQALPLTLLLGWAGVSLSIT